MSIELVLEKWLTAFKKYGHTLEIFESPSKKEMIKIGNNFRFILDEKRQSCYIWSATGAIHADAWIYIKKELNDSRPLYKSHDLLAGVVEAGNIHIYAAMELQRDVRSSLKRTDWSFSKRWVDQNKLADTLSRI